MVTTSNGGSFGADYQKDTEVKTESAPSQKKGSALKVCTCGNTIREDVEACPICFSLTEDAKDLLLG